AVGRAGAAAPAAEPVPAAAAAGRAGPADSAAEPAAAAAGAEAAVARGRRLERGRTRSPARPQSAGTNVIAAIITAPTAANVAYPNDAYTGSVDSFSPNSETSTVSPATSTECPAVAVASAAAARGVKPFRRHSTCRLTSNSASSMLT